MGLAFCLVPHARCETEKLGGSSAGKAESGREEIDATVESDLEGSAHGFPTLRDLNGDRLADGEFTQWLEGGQLHVKISYQFSSPRLIEETAVFSQEPRLLQQEWAWRELRDGKLYRRFSVDLRTGKATAETWDESKLKRRSKVLKFSQSGTFAGFGFALAIKSLRERLVRGERVELQAIGFTPTPRVVAVEIFYGGLDHIRMSGQTLQGDRFTIHPKIPKIAKLFVNAPDTRVWLINPPPAGFLRSEGPLAEPSDPVVRVDLLPGNQSGPAEPRQQKK